MSGGGSKQYSSEENLSKPTWEGGNPGQGADWLGFGETGFKPGEMGKKFGHDLNASYSQGPQVFDKSLYAGLTDQTKGLLDQSMGGPVGDVASGSWLDGGNPYAEGILNKALDNTSTRVNQVFSNSGRLGSTEHIEDLTGALANQELGFRYANFNDEYNRMTGAQDRTLGLSGMLDQDAQQTLTGENDLFRRRNDASLGHIQDYMGLFGQGQGSGAFKEPTNPFSNILGLGAGLLGML